MAVEDSCARVLRAGPPRTLVHQEVHWLVLLRVLVRVLLWGWCGAAAGLLRGCCGAAVGRVQLG